MARTAGAVRRHARLEPVAPDADTARMGIETIVIVVGVVVVLAVVAARRRRR